MARNSRFPELVDARKRIDSSTLILFSSTSMLVSKNLWESSHQFQFLPDRSPMMKMFKSKIENIFFRKDHFMYFPFTISIVTRHIGTVRKNLDQKGFWMAMLINVMYILTRHSLLVLEIVLDKRYLTDPNLELKLF